MCGIAGFSNFNQDYTRERKKWHEVLDKMNRVQKHRGPDGEGIYLNKNIGFSHVRLTVIDLSAGNQPMTRAEGGNRCTITYNGEIYNMKELRKKLGNEGVTFHTASDTEVVLAGYMRYGIDFVKELNGIFAFAIWDEKSKKLYLGRDRLGVKPLFYSRQEDTLVFSSEIKGLLAHPFVEAIVDKEGFCEIFGLGPAKTYGKGVFKNVKELFPGHFIEFSKDGMKDFAYWKLEAREHEDSYEETVEKTSFLLQDAVKKQMLSDIPICTFLSGGVDSSLVTAIAARELKKQGKKLNTFSFDFEDNAKHFKSNAFQPSEDRPWVDRMVEYADTNHRYLECNNKHLFECLFKAVDARDLPCMADVESSLLYFCSLVSEFNQVTLTGECADEIFGGYPWFHKQECFDAETFPWSMDYSPRKILLSDEMLSELPLEEYSRAAYRGTILETPVLEGENNLEKRRREIAYLNIKWFMVTLLDRMDRTSMHSGLEARVPLADYRILEYVFNVPWHMKCPNGLVKGLLRAAGEDYLPKDVLYRKKSPYPKTYHPEYEVMLKKALREVLEDPNAPIRMFIDKRKAESFMESKSDYGKPFYGQLMAGPQLLAYMLQINYWMEAYQIKAEV